jgi:hypothetical protein
LSSPRQSAGLKTTNEKQNLGAYPKQAEPTSKRQTKKRLTFDLLLLRFEGFVRVLGRLLQAKDRSLLLLNSLA